MFYNYCVKKKIEPYVYSAWVNKISLKNKEKKRFIVATYSALYILKRHVLGKNLKICNIYPWVSLTNYTVLDNNFNNLNLTFGTKKIFLQIVDVENVTNSIISFLKALFPADYQGIEYEIPFKIQIQKKKKKEKTNLVSLFVSFCHSLQIAINEPLITKMLKQFKRKPRVFDLSVYQIEQKFINPLLMSLKLASNIDSIKIDSTKVSHCLVNLGDVISKNKNIKELTICGNKKISHFNVFLQGLEQSNIESLYFINCHFNDNVMNLLINSNKTFKSLGFDQCGITSAMMNQILHSKSSLSSLSRFSLKNNSNIFSNNMVRSLFKFCTEKAIKYLELQNVGIDISILFDNIHNLSFVKNLNISGNSATDHIKNFSFPTTLESIELSNIKWGPSSLICTLLHTFQNGSFDFSNAIMSQDHWNTVFNELMNSDSSGLFINSFDWSGNPIDTRLLQFLLKFDSLNKLSLDYCTYSDEKAHSILNSIIALIQRQNITSFSFKGCKKRYNTLIINELFPILVQRNNIVNLDVSGNYIGSKGLNTIIKLINSSKSLKKLNFDDSRPKKVSTLTSLLKAISSSNSLVEVVEPKNDIKAILAKFPAMNETLHSNWVQCKKKFIQNQMNEENDDEEYISSEQTSFSNSYASTFDSHREIELEASWDVNINLNIKTGFSEWESMKNEFSLNNLTNVEI